MIIHGFAGIGWTEALAARGQHDTGLELNAAACHTRRAAGHRTIRCDVTQYPTWPFKGRNVKKIDTAEPMRWHYDLQPEWIAMEQVPSVLPVWQQYATILRRWGYSTAAGVLNAADYGLGQTRKRAVLLASRVGDVQLPAPTHGGLGQPAHVAMADVVGWGYTHRPAPSVTGGGTYTGGAEPFGNGTRQAMRRVMGTAAWRERNVPHLRPTVAECAALQGFRPGLEFRGGAGQQYLQVGNAVPPPLADAVLTAVGAFTEQQMEVAA